ncbi:GNAT family N-acetyltransferase [Amycolatopsis antarctica]|uniref:GNAT family N-acetyltransferase n=1 Tax=Amycolatopsis antarctica TaxID=1854586 RepID=A0A263D4F0_9PSEU|nr:GNAT family N-acetyltransferase [Amycolatopsis antarctica]OZM72948.1 GNAT family N-acetyltransferase [Amycolatopsis antarctica]
MSDHTTRTLRDDEQRAASSLFRSTLHAAPPSDEEWERTRFAFQPDRTLGVFDRELIGTARSFDSTVVVPGGAAVPLAAVTGVGVRPDRTRRGVLRELMRAQFEDLSARGTVAALLYATEGPIYGRFGYGVGTRGLSYTVDRRRAVFRPEAPRGGEVELLDVDAAMARLPEIYSGLAASRPATMARPSYWWAGLGNRLRKADVPPVTVLHHGAGGVDGIAQYAVDRDSGADSATMRVDMLDTASDAAFAGLWRYLLGVDLVDRVKAWMRPLDEPTELLFTDPRVCRSTGVEDEAWLRLVDVPAALAARVRACGRLVIEVDDPVLPSNSGRYLITPDEVIRTGEPAQLRMGVDALAMIYLGTWRPSVLAGTGRVGVLDPEAPAIADRLFGIGADRAAWCGTFF